MSSSNSVASGVYAIRCRKNSKLYIGSGGRICARWGAHLSELMSGSHPNDDLQKDFDKYGVESFEFSILEIVERKEDLFAIGRKWIGKYNCKKLYNTMLTGESDSRTPKQSEFIQYINGKWLVTDGTDEAERDKRMIWRDVDKDEIRERFCDCKLTNKPLKYVTFNHVVKTLEQSLGYEIESKRHRVDRKQYTYKLIVSFDEDAEKRNMLNRPINETGTSIAM